MQNAEFCHRVLFLPYLCSFYLFYLCIYLLFCFGGQFELGQIQTISPRLYFMQGLHFIGNIVYGLDRSSSQIHVLTICMYRFIQSGWTYSSIRGSEAPFWAESVDPHCYKNYCNWLPPTRCHSNRLLLDVAFYMLFFFLE